VLILPVLVRPMYAGNVGAAARIAANFGIARLVLVEPSCSLEEDDFHRMAMGADRHLAISLEPTLAAALHGIEVAIATTSGRHRDPRGLLTPVEARRRVVESDARSVALVFGPERSGLTREELHRCQLLLTIPSDADFPVLNLAQAVAVVLSSLAGEDVPRLDSDDPLDGTAPHAEFEAAMTHLERVLLDNGFLDPVNPARTMDQLRRLLGRAVPTRREIAVLRGLASHVDALRRRLEREQARRRDGEISPTDGRRPRNPVTD
jgi:tRNA/rRNA methyltransferase